jgi:hypothetical protein
LQTLASRYHPNVRGALLRCLDDGVAELRALALRILREARDPVVARAVLEQMRRPGFEKRAPDEAVAWYHCLAGLEQPGTVAFLAERLGQRNLLRSDIVLAHQVLAARALGEIGSPAAREVLEQTWRQGHLPGPLKTAVQAALHVSRGSDNA